MQSFLMNSSKSMCHLVDKFKVNGRSLALLSLTLASTMVIQIQIALFMERQNGTFKWWMTAHFLARAIFGEHFCIGRPWKGRGRMMMWLPLCKQPS
jgi:hypothetical protein